MINNPVERIPYRDDHYNTHDFDDSLISYDDNIVATQHAHPSQSFAKPIGKMLPNQPSQRTVDVLERGSATPNVRNGVFDFVEQDGRGDGLRVRFRYSKDDSKKDPFNEAMIEDEVVEMRLYSREDSLPPVAKRMKKIGKTSIEDELFGLFEVAFKDGVIREQEIGFRVASEGYMTITEVTQGTRADFCELRIGDIIWKVGDVTIIENNIEARRKLYEELVNYPSNVSLTIARKSEKKKIGKLFENFYQIGNKVKRVFTRSKYSQKEIKCRLNNEELEKREMMLLPNIKDPPQYFLFGEDDNEPPDLILKDSQCDDDRSKAKGKILLPLATLTNSIRQAQASIEEDHESNKDVQTIHSRQETYQHEDKQAIVQKDHTNQQPDYQKTPATSNTFSFDKDMADTSGYVTSNRNSCEVTNVGVNDSLTLVSLSTRKDQRRRKRRRGDCLIDNKENMAALSYPSLINNSSFCYNSKKKTFKQIANIDESDHNFVCNFCDFLPKTAASDRMATERSFIVQDKRTSCDREASSSDHRSNISTHLLPPICLFNHSPSSSQYPPSINPLTRSFDDGDDNRDANINNNNDNANSEFVVTEKLNQDNRTFDITQKLVVTLHDLEFKFKGQIINLATEIRTFAYKHDLERHFKELLSDVRELESLALQNCVSIQSWKKSLPSSDHLIRYCIHILKSYQLICISYFDNLGINIRRIDTLISSRNLGLNRSKFDAMMKWPAEHLRETIRSISDFAEDPGTPLSEPLHDVIIKGLLLLNRPIPYRKKVKIPKSKLKNRRVQFVAGL